MVNFEALEKEAQEIGISIDKYIEIRDKKIHEEAEKNLTQEEKDSGVGVCVSWF